MSLGGIGTSDSKTKINAPDRSVTVTGDNALLNQDSRRGFNTTVKVKGDYTEGSTTVVNNGAGSVEIADALKSVLDSKQKPIDNGFPIQDAIDSQLALRQKAAEDTVAAKSPINQRNLIIGAVAVVAVIALFRLVKQHKPA